MFNQFRILVAIIVTASLILLVSPLSPTATATVVSRASVLSNEAAGGLYVPIAPFRLVDTTSGTGGSATPIGPDATRTYGVLGHGDIPTSGVTAVVVDVAALDLSSGTTSGFRLWAGGEDMVSPTILRFDSGHLPVSNTAIVPVGATGQISINNLAGSAHYNLDVQGYFSTAGSGVAGGFVPITPTRVVDSTAGIGLPVGELASGQDYDVSISGNEIPTGAAAVFANVKVQDAEVDGGLRIGPGGVASSSPASVNYQAGVYSDTGLTIPMSANGSIRIRNVTAGSHVHVRIDIQGYFSHNSDEGFGYTPLAATRYYDSRETTKIPAGATRVVPAAGLGGLPSADAVSAIATTVLAMNWTNSGSIILFNPDGPAPGTSNVSFNTVSQPTTGVSSTSIVVPSVAAGEVAIKNTSSGPVDVLLTAQGWFGVVDPFGDSTDPEEDTDPDATYMDPPTEDLSDWPEAPTNPASSGNEFSAVPGGAESLAGRPTAAEVGAPLKLTALDPIPFAGWRACPGYDIHDTRYRVVHDYKRPWKHPRMNRSYARLYCGLYSDALPERKFGFRHIAEKHSNVVDGWGFYSNLIGRNWRDLAGWAFSWTLRDPDLATDQSWNRFCYQRQFFFVVNGEVVRQMRAIVILGRTGIRIMTAFPRRQATGADYCRGVPM